MCPAGVNTSIREESFTSLFSLWQKHSSALKWRVLFTLPFWLETWWETFDPGGELYLRSVWEGERLCGIAPMYIKGRTAYMLGSEDVCDYVDFPVAEGKEKPFFASLLEDLPKKGVNTVMFGLLRPDSAAYSAISFFSMSGKNLEAEWEEVDVSFERELPEDWDSCLATLSKKQRHEVRRKLRRLYEAAEVSYRELQGEDITPGQLQTFLSLFALSREDKAAFLTDDRKAFFLNIAEKMSRAGIFRMGLLEINSGVAALTMHFVHEGRVYLYNSGHDPRFRNVSAGLMSKILCIKESIEKQRRVFDFLKGREVFKERLGGKEVPLYSCRIFLS